ncbi:hypothetical protein lam_605 [Candidatus Liberibacter americanus str. Sao Paulo]|uniref:Uncharacterized protein n=1 Tax=Candidatus Liberibacter americanus str. Sao Paulo TaxID=1261131 RepID=U6B890_9HYPH|nr:hypothetical protein lam_605 [Candidatus Liberibacter americanus str. Sao Paulo]
MIYYSRNYQIIAHACSNNMNMIYETLFFIFISRNSVIIIYKPNKKKTTNLMRLIQKYQKKSHWISSSF